MLEDKTAVMDSQDKTAVMDSHISQLRMANDNTDEYQCHLCLRIDAIEIPSPG